MGSSGGSLSERLWWIAAIVGGLLSIAAALSAEGLVRQRIAAEDLNDTVRRLLGEQRSIALQVQRALLPKALPPVQGVELAARYLPGVDGVEIGGDWYDIIALGHDRVFFVVGDVSGRGLDAGTVMASLRFAIRGFVTEGHTPAEVLNALSHVLDFGRDGHFATVVCGIADIAGHRITLASAGHLPPLLVGDGSADWLTSEVGPPVGVRPGAEYTEATVRVPAHAMLLAYTDGLVERRGEVLDDGLQRLRDAAVKARGSMEDILDSVLGDLARDRVDDDTAVVGLRWLA